MTTTIIKPQAADTLTTGIGSTVNSLADLLLRYAIPLAAVGALAMALIEGWKKFWDSRTKFHSRRFTMWVGNADVLADVLVLCTGISRSEATAAAQRLHASRGKLPWMHAFEPHPAHALFALDVARMMGAIQEASDVALTAPKRHSALYAFLTAGSDPVDARVWSERAEAGFADIANMAAPGAAERQQVKELSDRAARLRQMVKRKLDAFQLLTSDRWASSNQFAAIVVGFMLMYGLLTWMRLMQSTGAPSALAIVPISLLGGVLSPVAKDLVSSLRKVRGG